MRVGSSSGSARRRGGAAAFPCRLHVGGVGIILDANNVDVGVLKGLNVHCHSTANDVAGQYWGPGGSWDTGAYTAMQTQGFTLIRQVCHWDAFEPTASTARPTAIADLDASIANAKAVGMYSVLDLHLNVGRVPGWAQTTGNEWTDYQAHGEYITEYLADRYKDELAVVGFNPNEPPAITAANLLTGYQTCVPWYRDIATWWPLWICPSAYGNGTPYPSNGDNMNVASYLALDTRGHGIIAQLHDYLNDTGTNSTDGYQSNGAIDPVQQVTNGSHYHGWGGAYAYPNTAHARTAFANHLSTWTTLRTNGAGRVAIGVGEFGMDNTGSEGAFGTDKVTAFRNAGFSVELWWNYDTNAVSDPFAARPASSWRAAVTNWLANATARA